MNEEEEYIEEVFKIVEKYGRVNVIDPLIERWLKRRIRKSYRENGEMTEKEIIECGRIIKGIEKIEDK